VRLSGIGTIGLRGRARFTGTPKTAEVLRKGGKWYLSVTFDVHEASIARKSGTESMAFDWGLKTLLTQVTGNWDDGVLESIENPHWLKSRLNTRGRFSGWGYKTDGDGWKLLQQRSIHKPGKKYCGTSYGVVFLK
jgi:transposase